MTDYKCANPQVGANTKKVIEAINLVAKRTDGAYVPNRLDLSHDKPINHDVLSSRGVKITRSDNTNWAIVHCSGVSVVHYPESREFLNLVSDTL